MLAVTKISTPAICVGARSASQTAPGGLLRVAGRVVGLHERGELVAADPRHRDRGRQGDAEPRAHVVQHGVRIHVAEAVVHRLEVVDVEDQKRDARPAGPRARDRLLDPLLEKRPVRKAGEGIVERLVTQALLRLALLRDVEQVPLERDGHAGRPEDRPGLVVDPHDAPVPGDQPVLEGEPVAFVRATVRVEDGLAVLRVEDPDEELAITLPLGERVPEHRLDLRAGVDVGALVVDRVDVDDERQLLDERPEALLRDPETLLARPQDRVGARVDGASGASAGAGKPTPLSALVAAPFRIVARGRSATPRARYPVRARGRRGRQGAAQPRVARSAGNSTTSRIDSLPVRSITKRSIPKPRPPVGGIPYESAST